MKRNLILTIAALLITAQAFADKITLKDGRIIEGKVVSEASYYVIVQDEQGNPTRFNREQIEKIEKPAQDPRAAFPPIQKLDQISKDKIALIQRLLLVSGVKEAMFKRVNQIIEDAPAERRTELYILLDVEKLLEQIVPIYGRYYTDDELKEMIHFYESPIGKKFLQAQPFVIQDSMETTIKYFEKKVSEPALTQP